MKKMHKVLLIPNTTKNIPLEQIEKIIDDDEREYIIEFLASGSIAVMRKWFNNGMNVPIEQVISYLVRYSAALITA